MRLLIHSDRKYYWLTICALCACLLACGMIKKYQSRCGGDWFLKSLISLIFWSSGFKQSVSKWNTWVLFWRLSKSHFHVWEIIIVDSLALATPPSQPRMQASERAIIVTNGSLVMPTAHNIASDITLRVTNEVYLQFEMATKITENMHVSKSIFKSNAPK